MYLRPDSARPRLDAAKFRDPFTTAKGEARASVPFAGLRTLWFNTGTLCNITCASCYIESSPTNDRLAYLSAAEVAGYLDQIAPGADTEIGFTGGEPFMNRALPSMLRDALQRGFRVLVLTNAMQPLWQKRRPLLDLAPLAAKLTMRVSLDHYEAGPHDEERGAGSWELAVRGLDWLAQQGFRVAVAGRAGWGEAEPAMRQGFARLFAARGLPIDAADPGALVLFPEMDAQVDVPEITEACWGILKRDPRSVMCATSRMVVKRRGAPRPVVLSCTLIPYEDAFEMGERLADTMRPVRLNHPHCAKFCVLGGASCSA